MILIGIRAHPYGVDLSWRLLSERPFEANISHQEMPTPGEHAAYVLHHPYREWFVIEVDGIPVGTLALTTRNEIAIAILSEYRRKGYATEAIKLAMKLHEPLPEEAGVREGRYVANVAPGNLASHALFTGMGAKLVSMTYRFGG